MTVEETLENAVAEIKRSGPQRVLIDAEGGAVNSKRAREQYGVTPDIIFIRADGWTLGAPSYWEMNAERLWPDEWIGYLRRGDEVATPYLTGRTPDSE